MPVYEYVCDACENKMEVLRSMKQADDAVACEKCGSRKTRRVHSLVAAPAGVGATHVHTASCNHCGDPRGSCAN